MFAFLHFTIFGLTIALVDVATRRIYRAVVWLASLSSLPFISRRGLLFALVATSFFLLLRTKWRDIVGLGDILIVPLASFYAVASMVYVPILFLAILVIAHSALRKATRGTSTGAFRCAGAPFILLAAIMSGELLGVSAIIR